MTAPGLPPANHGELPTFERPVRVKIGRGRPHTIGTISGDTWPDVSRSLITLLRATADEIEESLARQLAETPPGDTTP